MKYAKITKYISWALLIIGAAIAVLGFVLGFEENDAALVDTLLYFGYCMVGAAIAIIVLLGIVLSAQNNPKGLLKTAIVIIAAAVVIGVAYVLAPGDAPVGYHGVEQTQSLLKLTDTILILTYAFVGVAIVSILFGVVLNIIRK